jgi:hypothetical protein
MPLISYCYFPWQHSLLALPDSAVPVPFALAAFVGFIRVPGNLSRDTDVVHSAYRIMPHTDLNQLPVIHGAMRSVTLGAMSGRKHWRLGGAVRTPSQQPDGKQGGTGPRRRTAGLEPGIAHVSALG